jgi:hypothetical protein
MRGFERDDICVIKLSRDEALARGLVFDDCEFAEQHLISAKAAVGPGIQVDKHALVGAVARRAEYYLAARGKLPAHLFEHDAAVADLAFDYLLNPERDISKYAMAIFIGRARDCQNARPHYGASAYY